MPTAPASHPGPRILVIKLSSLGDLFHALPAVSRIKTAWGATVDWVTQREYADLVACFGAVDRVIAFPRRATLRHFPAFWRALRRERYDHVLDFQGLLKSALIARAARSADRIGPSFHREGSPLFYTRLAGPRNKARHAVEENLDAVRLLAADAPESPLQFRFPAFPTTAPEPRVACAPLSRWPSKNWPASHFVAVLQRLQAERGAAVYLLGSAMDRWSCEGIAAQLKGPVFTLAGHLSLPQMGGLLQTMNLLLANDTGPIHMAAALNVPVLAVFGPTDPVRTGPYGTGHAVVAAPGFDCRPCFRRACAKGDPAACLEAVTPETVAAQALRMLG